MKKTVLQYIRNYKFNSLFLKNFVLITLAIYIPLVVICVFIYTYFSRIYMQDLVGREENTLRRIQEISDTVYKNVLQIGKNMCGEKAVLSMLEYERYEWQVYEVCNEINTLTKDIIRVNNEYIDSIYLYAEKSDYIVTENGLISREIMRDLSWYDNYVREEQKTGIRNWFRIQSGSNGDKCVLSLAFYLPYDERTEKTGTLVLNMNFEWLESLADSGTQDASEIFLVDDDGRISYHRNRDKAGEILEMSYLKDNLEKWNGSQGITSDGSHIVTYRSADIGSWEYVYVTQLDGYNHKILILRRVVTFAVILLLFLSVLVSFWISTRVFLPIKNIIQMLDNPENFYETNLSDSNTREQKNELKYIVSCFMKQYMDHEQTRENLTEHVTRLKQTQIALLQTQINPHFLFNTLQTINFMAIGLTNSDNQVSEAIGNLSTMLRGMLKVDINTCTLGEEIEYCKSYISLEKFRYGDGLQVFWDIDEEIMDCCVIRIMLQPILENSIVHGFKNLKYGGKIFMKGRKEEELLVLEVTDDGIGQTAEWIRNTQKKLSEVQPIVGSHIGIQNVNQRIRIMFGNEYGIRLVEMKQGFAIRIELPLRDA